MRLAGWLTAAGLALIVLGWLASAGYYAARKFHGMPPSEMAVNTIGGVVLVGVGLVVISAPTIMYHLHRKR